MMPPTPPPPPAPRTLEQHCPAWLPERHPHRFNDFASGYRCVHCLVALTTREASAFAEGLARGDRGLIPLANQ